MLKKLCLFLFVGILAVGVNICAFADDDFYDEYDEMDIEEMAPEEITPENADNVSSNALEDFQTEGSLFERITTLEQEKVVVQLEKERAQLDLDLERLNAEKIKLQMELDTLSGRAEQQQHELEAAKAQLEI